MLDILFFACLIIILCYMCVIWINGESIFLAGYDNNNTCMHVQEIQIGIQTNTWCIVVKLKVYDFDSVCLRPWEAETRKSKTGKMVRLMVVHDIVIKDMVCTGVSMTSSWIHILPRFFFMFDFPSVLSPLSYTKKRVIRVEGHFIFTQMASSFFLLWENGAKEYFFCGISTWFALLPFYVWTFLLLASSAFPAFWSILW